MKNKTISWVWLENDETIELNENQKVIGTHLAPPIREEDDDHYAIALVIENEGGLK